MLRFQENLPHGIFPRRPFQRIGFYSRWIFRPMMPNRHERERRVWIQHKGQFPLQNNPFPIFNQCTIPSPKSISFRLQKHCQSHLHPPHNMVNRVGTAAYDVLDARPNLFRRIVPLPRIGVVIVLVVHLDFGMSQNCRRFRRKIIEDNKTGNRRTFIFQSDVGNGLIRRTAFLRRKGEGKWHCGQDEHFFQHEPP